MQVEIDSIEADQQRLRKWLVISAIGLGILGVAGWFGHAAYRHFKEQREQGLAQAFLAKGDFRNALLSARQALQLDATNAVACRIMAELADRAHSPETTNYLQRLVQSEPTIENKLRLAAAGLRYEGRPFSRTAEILEALAPVATQRADYHVVAGSLALSTGQLPAAETHFEAAATLNPTNRLFQLNLAVVRLSMTNAAKADLARATMEGLCTDTNFAAAALRALIVDRLAHQAIAAANRYSQQLLAQPEATLSDRLQHLKIIQQLHSDDFASQLQAVQSVAGTNAAAIAAVAGWMQANELLAGSLLWLTNLPAELRLQLPIRLTLADGYDLATDWRTLRDFTSSGNWGEAEFLRLAFLARAWSQLDVPAVAESTWNAAVSEAGGRYGALTTLLELTSKWKLLDKREDLLERFCVRFPRETWAQKELATAYFVAGKTAELHDFYGRLLARFPNNAEYENNLAATALLLKTNLAQAGRWAQEVYAGNTNNPAYATTYAFALHRQGRTSEGLAVLQNLAGALQQRPEVALYYGCLLAAAGKAETAAPYLQIAATQGHWLPEEQKLLSEALGK